jgi:hypothetical protein
VLNAKKLLPPMVRVFCGGGRDVYYFIIADPVCERLCVAVVCECERKKNDLQMMECVKLLIKDCGPTF